MKIKKGKEKEYQDWSDKNKDPYGNACFLYANYWAELIEFKINDNLKIDKKLLEKLSNDVDEKPGMGISGYMFSASKQILISCWEHGHLIEYYYTDNWKDPKRKLFLERQLKLERILKE